MKKKESSFLLVDGYNIIHSWAVLKELAKDSLEDARDKLIEILCDYKGYVEDNIILVFDAHKVRGNTGEYSLYNNIYVVYTKEAETADHYIEKTVESIINNYNVTVATSDNLEQVIIIAKGAVRLSARELFNRINQKKEAKKQYAANKEIKQNLLFDNLSPELAAYLERLRTK